MYTAQQGTDDDGAVSLVVSYQSPKAADATAFSLIAVSVCNVRHGLCQRPLVGNRRGRGWGGGGEGAKGVGAARGGWGYAGSQRITRLDFIVHVFSVAAFVLCCCFTSTETVRNFREGEPRTATSIFTQLLSATQSLMTMMVMGSFMSSDVG